MSDTPFLHRILLRVGALPGVRLFRCNNGVGWVGTLVWKRGGRVLLDNARPLRAGLVKGSGDLIGWVEREITPDMVGQRVAVFASLEAKEGTGRPDKDQRTWLQNVKDAGGIAGIVRSVDDAHELIDRK